MNERSLLLAMVGAVATACGSVTPEDEVPDAPVGGAAPMVSGETSAGHGFPIWTWNKPDGATAFRHRLDGSGWVTVDPTISRWAPATELAVGDHLFEVEAQNAEGAWSEPGSFTTRIEYYERPGYWTGVRRSLHRTPLGHEVVIACDDCYQSELTAPADNLRATLDRLHAAQDAGSDALQIDVRVKQGVWYVAGAAGDPARGALVSDVLADGKLRDGDQTLIVQLTDLLPQEGDIRQLVDLLLDGGYARNGRPLVLRAVEGARAGLDAARLAATPEAHPFQHAYVRYHLQVAGGEDPLAIQTKLTRLAQERWNAVELDHRMKNLYGALVFARSRGLGVGLVPVDTAVHCVVFRDAVDLILAAGDVGACGRRATATSPILFADVSQQAVDSGELRYYARTEPATVSLAADRRPSLHADKEGEDRFGTSLSFKATELDHIPFFDGDNDPGGGYLVAMVVNFDLPLDPGEGKTAALLNKSSSGGFAFEVFHAIGGAAVLRFGVCVKQASSCVDQYATHPMDKLNDTESYVIVGSYDGKGAVHLWINGVEGTPSAEVTGGVLTNDLPIVLGGDPEPGGAVRFPWGGLVQSVLIADWKR